MICPFCAEEIAQPMVSCVHCGSALGSSDKGRCRSDRPLAPKVITWILVGITTLLMFLTLPTAIKRYSSNIMWATLLAASFMFVAPAKTWVGGAIRIGFWIAAFLVGQYCFYTIEANSARPMTWVLLVLIGLSASIALIFRRPPRQRGIIALVGAIGLLVIGSIDAQQIGVASLERAAQRGYRARARLKRATSVSAGELGLGERINEGARHDSKVQPVARSRQGSFGYSKCLKLRVAIRDLAKVMARTASTLVHLGCARVELDAMTPTIRSFSDANCKHLWASQKKHADAWVQLEDRLVGCP